jgi:hypothetical protein
LDGGVSDDAWRRLVVYLSQQYKNTPTGAVGRHFIKRMAELLEGIEQKVELGDVFGVLDGH